MLADTGLADTGLAGTGLAGLGLLSSGLPGTGFSGSGPGPDDAETAPLAVLIRTQPRSFGSEASGLADPAVTDDGALDGAAAGSSAAHNGGAGDELADRPSALRPPDYRPPSHARQRSRQAARTAVSEPAGKQPGVARGVLVTPWFAAATGFVIAASLWIYSPHPKLAFPSATPDKVPCLPDGCGPSPSQSAGGSLASKSGRRLQQHNSAKTDGSARQSGTAASGLTFGYYVHQTADGNFVMMIRVTGKRPIKGWHLAFVLSGDRIQLVRGADWQAAGSDGGTASPLTGDQSGDRDGHHGGVLDKPGVIFWVIASGTPARPTQCRFDGASCTFHEPSIDSQGRAANSAATDASQ